jgi:hypothetical protein
MKILIRDCRLMNRSALQADLILFFQSSLEEGLGKGKQ